MINGSNTELSGVKDFRRLDRCVIPSAIHCAAGLPCLKPKILVNGCQRLKCSVGDSEGTGSGAVKDPVMEALALCLSLGMGRCVRRVWLQEQHLLSG